MAITLQTTSTTLKTITDGEISKANRAFADLESCQSQITTLQAAVANRESTINSLNATITTKNARILELEAIIAAIPTPPVVVPPPVVIPPVVVPPVTGKTGLYVDGKDIRSKTGAKLTLRGIETMFGSSGAGNPTRSVEVCKSLGANMVGPLYQFIDLNKIKAHLDACKAANIVCAVNGDHMGQTSGVQGRDWFCRPETVVLLKKYDNIILQCETELGNEETTGAQWSAEAIALVKKFRDAGHTAPIKIGSPFSGRDPRLAISHGRQVLEADPLKNVVFTWQAYWGIDPNAGWTYQQDLGFPRPTVADPIKGHKACTDAILASGLCFIVGLDAVDDIGATGYVAHSQYLHSLGIHWQFWALSGDGRGSNLSNGYLDSTTTQHGAAMKPVFLAQSALNSF